MKKRILALALAGTTAFSVFGAAMSANAANVYWGGTSSHIGAYDGAYYQSYTPAGDITWGSTTTKQETVTLDNTFYTLPSAEKDEDGNYVEGTTIYMRPSAYADAVSKDSQIASVVTELNTRDDGVTYYEDVAEFAKYNDYDVVTTEEGNKIFTKGDVRYVIAESRSNPGRYGIFIYEDEEGNTEWDDAAQTAWKSASGTFYIPESYYDETSLDGVEVYDLNGVVDHYEANHRNEYFFIDTTGEENDATNGTITNLDRHPKSAGQAVVVKADPTDVNGIYTTSGATTLDAVDPTDIDAVLEETVYPSGVVYLYDYYDNIPSTIDADEFAEAWADGTVAKLLSKANDNKSNGTISPVTSYRGRGVREEVMYEWEDFLDELGISDASNAGLTRWAEDILENYAYTYYNADVINVTVDWANGKWDISFGRNVNLYNFDQLIADIMELAPAKTAENAQTSELIYLMQQYHKYVDEGFVTEKPVETDDWGDLLVALAQAPTEDDFRTSAAYRRYTNKVEDLVEQYEEAETSVAVAMAEEELYSFVTDYQSAYTYSNKADTAVLATAIDNTYFNTNWQKVGEEYAREDMDGLLNDTGDFESISEYSNAWALYPKTDYTGTNTGAYPGVDNTQKIEGVGVNDSYYWFYNVYTLAYNVYTSNKYQSVIDLMATTLDEAVNNLVPTTSAYASGVLAAEEQADKLAALVETDYTAAMWNNRSKIYTHITERVSNDEIGRQGAVIATDAAEETAKYMGYQKFQTTVTRSDINSVSAAKTEAETALEALRNDEEKYNAAQANALEKAIDDCEYIIDLYNGNYSKSKNTQSVNGDYNAATGDKDQILKSDCTNAVQAVEDAINFSNIIMGWSQDKDGNWKYGTEEGYLNDGWHQVDGGKTWFYFEENETAKQSEWWQDPETGTWYWFNSNCGAAVGWAKIDGDWYYFKGNNAMKTGWEKVEGSWYYMNSSGKMVTGWCQINGTWYYFSKESNALGQMLANTTTPDGYKVDANGALVE